MNGVTLVKWEKLVTTAGLEPATFWLAIAHLGDRSQTRYHCAR